MKIPKQLKIGGTTFQVKVVEDWIGSEGAEGMMSTEKKDGNTIYIKSTLTREAQAITLIHEMLHAMNSTMNHEFLDSLSEQIYQAFNDNQLLR